MIYDCLILLSEHTTENLFNNIIYMKYCNFSVQIYPSEDSMKYASLVEQIHVHSSTHCYDKTRNSKHIFHYLQFQSFLVGLIKYFNYLDADTAVYDDINISM